jgi:transposase
VGSATFPSIPIDTIRAARAVFGRSNFYLTTGDQVEQLFNGLILEGPTGRLQISLKTQARLYLITIFQFIETLPDHQAADALRKRIDWKYALHVPLNYPGLEPASFCEFRRWLRVDSRGQQNLQTLLWRLSEIMDLTSKQRTGVDPGQVVDSVCQFSRLARIWEALNTAMEVLAARHPEWLLAASLPHWYQRYGDLNKDLNLRVADLERQNLAQRIGADGLYLLEAISGAGDPHLEELNEILVLREVWDEQFASVEGKVLWRNEVCAGCALPAKLSHQSQGEGKKEVETE